MAYATIDSVFNRFPAIASNVGTGEYEVASVEVASTFIAQAEGLIDAYLSERYIVPLSSTSLSPLITRIAADLAICDMLVDKLPTVPEFAVRRCVDAKELLKKLAKGELDLPLATLANTTGGEFEIWSTTMEYHPVFSPILDPLEQTPDVDRVDDDLTDRDDDAGLDARFRNPCI